MNPASPLQTCLSDLHRNCGGRMVDFAGWEMPVQYESIQKEHMATRSSVGIFDVGHMGRICILGEKALDFVNRLVTRNVTALQAHQVGYTLVCNTEGGVQDDILVYRGEGSTVSLVVNASNRQKILQWFQEYRDSHGDDVEIRDNTLETGMIAVQGPGAEIVTGHILRQDLSRMGYYRWREVSLLGTPVCVSRTGYTGEDGFELSAPPDMIRKMWLALFSAGAEPCGLGARDILRLEMGYPLYGHELTEQTNPWEIGLGRVIDLGKSDFIGKTALQAMKERGISKRLTGLVLKERGIPREGYPVLAGDKHVGIVTSGGYSLCRKAGIALALVEAGCVPEAVEIRGRAIPAAVEKPPFIPSRVKAIPKPK
ncbi:MAG TPA: glycine cleavage system aminomethyltransferase GcvT [bacterium]|nr:glycine cleavage system aminomethyltransferase GcvT [bacterium]HQL63460.1 glycine cleavage system aminomethyltransferase GcvT [bacterium]